MAEQMRMAPAGVFWWSCSVWIAPVLAGAALLFPLMAFPAVACLALALVLGFSTCKALLNRPGTRGASRRWLGATALSLAAQLANIIVLATPAPRYADYLPAEEVSPVRQMILDSSWPLHWAAGGTALVAAIAGVVIFRILMSHLRTELREPAARAVS